MHWFNLTVWLLAGFCGTVPWRYRWDIRVIPPVKPEPDPGPDDGPGLPPILAVGPRPHPWLVVLVGILAGVAGGWISYRFGTPGVDGPLTLGQTLATATVGLALSVVASGVVAGGWDPSAPQRRGAASLR